MAATDGDAGFASELVQMFIESGDAVLRNIREAMLLESAASIGDMAEIAALEQRVRVETGLAMDFLRMQRATR